MSIINSIRQEVEKREPGSILTYRDFDVPADAVPVLIKALSTFYREGMLKRITKGMYYKQEQSEFGPLALPMRKLLEKLLDEQKNKIAYITGANVYNSLFLTTQLSTEYVIATDRPRSPITVKKTTIRFVRAHLSTPPSNPFLAQLLDAMKDIREIPAASPTYAALVLVGHLRKLPSAELQELVEISTAYPPSTRAVLGVLLEQLGEKALYERVQASLNPLSKFKLGLDLTQLPTSLNWNIA
jgi:hypothetical protein